MDRNVCSVCVCIWYCAADVKACPRCGALIVKMDDGSCNHMTCTVCAAEFCWLCMQEISDIHYLRHDSQNLLTYYFTPGRTAEYCNDCLSLCLCGWVLLAVHAEISDIYYLRHASVWTYLLITPPPVGEQSIVMSVSVCLYCRVLFGVHAGNLLPQAQLTKLIYLLTGLFFYYVDVDICPWSCQQGT